MITIQALNVNDAYRVGMSLVSEHGKRHDSRNGPVLVMDEPVTTQYAQPRQRVLFDVQRDANPFFHLFEAMWMLAGRNDLKTLTRFIPSFEQFSDDGIKLFGAYGYRWRHWDAWGHDSMDGTDQLDALVKLLRDNPSDRRAMLLMWDPKHDLCPPPQRSKDIPCNDIIKFRVRNDCLDMYVFCRSNDIVFGAYGANAVHLSFLQEYMAARIGVRVGMYEQISCDYHAYVDTPYKWSEYWPLKDRGSVRTEGRWINPYLSRAIHVHPLVHDVETFDQELHTMVDGLANSAFAGIDTEEWRNPFFHNICAPMFRAHMLYKENEPGHAAALLEATCMTLGSDLEPDWLVAGREWMQRRAIRRQKRFAPPDAP